jgi:hypothetical protein
MDAMEGVRVLARVSSSVPMRGSSGGAEVCAKARMGMGRRAIRRVIVRQIRTDVMAIRLAF